MLFQKRFCFKEQTADSSARNNLSRFALGVAAASFFTLAVPQAQAKGHDESTMTKVQTMHTKLSDVEMDRSDLQQQKIQLIKSVLPTKIRNHPLALRLSVALQMGREAGQAILAVKASRNLQTQIKGDNTPVTLADQASNHVICQTINRLYPDDGILSEETITGGKTLNDAIAKGVDADWTWVIDPLDGTKAFIKSTGLNASNLDPRYQGKHYGVHIGLLHKGEPVLGANYYPEIDTFYFVLDDFAYKQIGNDPAVRVVHKSISGIHPILNPTDSERDIVGKIYQKLLGTEEANRLNTKGIFLDSFGIKMASIGEGNGCNLFIAPAGGPGFWDVCSMLLFVQAAGGMVSDWEGNPINFRDRSQSGLLPKGVVISMDPEMHKQIIAIIAELTLAGHMPRFGQKGQKKDSIGTLRTKSNAIGIDLSDLQNTTQELTMIKIETYSKEEIATHASLLEEWMRRDYIHYPYLWMPIPTETSLDVFLNEKSTLLTIVKREGRVVGMAAGMPFESEYLSNYFEAPLVKLAEEQGIRPETLYYISFFLTAPDCRNEKIIVEAIYNAQAKYAQSLLKTHICFWSPLDNPLHSLKPTNPTPIEPWGYVIGNYKPMHIELNLPWNTLQVDGSGKQEIHPVQFFMKSL